MENHGVTSILVALFLLEFCRLCWCDPQLELSAVVYRHGDRTPVVTWPTDPYASPSLWPQGFGQLTILGMQQHYLLGHLLRERYINTTYPGFLFENYTRVQTYVRSTDYDRTLMSAEAQLSAFFPPNVDQMFVDNLSWQPIPVHTVPLAEDNLLAAYEISCSYYQQLLNDTYSSTEFLQVVQQNQDLMQLLRNNTGVPNLSFLDLRYVDDTLLIESIYNRTPDWYNITLYNQIKNLTDYTSALMFSTLEMRRLAAGVWVNEVVTNMNYTVTRNPQFKDQKLFLYSAHDTTVAAMMSALGVYNGIQPPYASAFIVELFSNNSDFFVKLFYRNDTTSDNIEALTIPWCEGATSCTWAQFVNFTKALIPTDWTAECARPPPTSSPTAPSPSPSLSPNSSTNPPTISPKNIFPSPSSSRLSNNAVAVGLGVPLALSLIANVILVSIILWKYLGMKKCVRSSYSPIDNVI